MDGLALAAGPNHTLPAKPSKVLRDEGLPNAQARGQDADRLFFGHQLADEHQAGGIGERLEKGAGVLRGGLEGGGVQNHYCIYVKIRIQSQASTQRQAER